MQTSPSIRATPELVGLAPLQRLRRYLTPRATDPEVALRERAIRFGLVLVAITRTLTSLVLIAGQDAYFDSYAANMAVVAFLMLALIGCGQALRARRTGLAGLLLLAAWGITDVLGAVRGYAAPGVG